MRTCAGAYTRHAPNAIPARRGACRRRPGCGCARLTASRKCSPSSVQKVESATTRTVAVRGTSRSSAISPTNAGAPSTLRAARQVDLDRPFGEDVEAVAVVTGGEERRAGRRVPPARAPRRALPSAGGEGRRGTGTVAIAASCCSGTTAPASIDASARRMTTESSGRIAPASRASSGRRRGGGAAVSGRSRRRDRRRRPPRRGRTRGRRPPQRQCAGSASPPRCRRRCCRFRAGRARRSPPTCAAAPRERAAARRSTPVRARSRRLFACGRRARAPRRADDRADARRRLQEPDAGVTEAEQLERDDDDQDAVRAGHERLCAVEADHDAQARLGANGAEAGGDPARVLVSVGGAGVCGCSTFGMRATNEALQR